MKFRPHISLEVTNLAAAVQFYETVFATEATKLHTDYANFRLEAPALHLSLILEPTKTPTTTGQHFGVELFDEADLDAWQQRITEAGLVPRLETAVTCCYAIANKFWLRDPDGHEWEFWVRQAEATLMHGEPVACCAPIATPTCCGA